MRDKDNLKSIAVSTLGAGITTGITTKLNIVKPTTFTDKLTKNAIDGATNTALQSTINGDSFKDTLKHQAVNSVVMAGAKIGANEIGGAYYDGNINKVEQLILHAGLGAVSSKLTGGDYLSGAVSGVVGEVAGGYLKNNTGLDNESIVKYSGLISGLSAIVVSKANNGDVKDITNSAFAGQRVGQNAVENNLLYDQLLGDSKTTSDYTEKTRKVKELNIARPHKGVDTIPAEGNDNTTVHASADGTVIYTEPQVDKTTGELKGWGNQIVIEHEDENGNKYITRSAHLKEKPDIPVGTKVREGQPIGIMGNTGGSAGAHLHYELIKYEPANPKADKNGWVHVNPQLPENNIGNHDHLWETPYQDNKREYENIMEQLNSPRVIMPSVIINRH